MRTFQLVRNEDFSGVSGTGNVAEGVQFNNGKCVMCWDTNTSSIAVYENVIDLVTIHGHEGRTVVIFDDNGEEVSDLVGPEEVIEEYLASGMEISADGFGMALDIDKLLKAGHEWEDMPNLLGTPDVTVSTLKTLHLIAQATGTI